MSANHPEAEGSLFANAIRRLDQAGKIAGLDTEVVELLKHPKAVMHFSIPVRIAESLSGLPCPPQQPPRPDQRRHPLPPGRRPG